MTGTNTSSEVSALIDEDLESLLPEDLESSASEDAVMSREELGRELDSRWTPGRPVVATQTIQMFRNCSPQCGFCERNCTYPCPRVGH